MEAIVYYLGDRDSQEIKIGTTTNLRNRMIRLVPAYTNRVLLAVEPGSFPLERRRHRQFRLLHVHGEWYRRAPLLMEHVNEVRALYGIPDLGERMARWLVAPLVTGRSGLAMSEGC